MRYEFNSNGIIGRLLGAAFLVAAISGSAHADSFETCAKKLEKASSVMTAPCDPFDGLVWHAVQGSWPGTLKFDKKQRTVLLEPLGAQAIHASYSYTMDATSKKERVKALTGTLTLTNKQGQTSKATYRIEDRNLTLRYEGFAAPDEHYLRMTPAEEAAEKARIQQLAKEGKLKIPTGLQP